MCMQALGIRLKIKFAIYYRCFSSRIYRFRVTIVSKFNSLPGYNIERNTNLLNFTVLAIALAVHELVLPNYSVFPNTFILPYEVLPQYLSH